MQYQLFTSGSEVRDGESRKPVVDSCQLHVSLSDTDNSCKVCCRNLSGPCVPYVDAEQKNLFLRKGKPCTVGFCDMNVSIISNFSVLWESVLLWNSASAEGPGFA